MKLFLSIILLFFGCCAASAQQKVYQLSSQKKVPYQENAKNLIKRFYEDLLECDSDPAFRDAFVSNNIEPNAKFKPDYYPGKNILQYLSFKQYLQGFVGEYKKYISPVKPVFKQSAFTFSDFYLTDDRLSSYVIVDFDNVMTVSGNVHLSNRVSFYCYFPTCTYSSHVLVWQVEPKEKEVVAISGTSNSGSNTNSDNTTKLYNKAVRFYADSDYKSAFPLFKQLAESGNAKAQNYVGSMYQYNKGIAQNNIEAVKWFRKSAEQGNSSAQCSLGYMYYSATGVSRNYAEAIKWFRESAEQGNSMAMYNMGVAYKNGFGVQKDTVEAVNWFKKAKENGDKDADGQLKQLNVSNDADKYNKAVRLYTNSDYKSALPLFKQLAEAGNADAQNYVGIMYYKGNGVTRDFTEAVKWYRRSAEQGNMYGQSNLASMYESGWGISENLGEAARWYRKAAEQGLSRSQSNLGYMYQYGKGVSLNYTEAVKWYRKSAEQGNVSGQNNLGYMYHSALGVSRDYVEAVKWYRKSAEQGNSKAMYNLGIMYKNGFGVQKDTVEAVNWFKKAKENGDKDADGQLKQMGVIEIKRTR